MLCEPTLHWVVPWCSLSPSRYAEHRMVEARHLTALSVPLPEADTLVRAAARTFEPTSPMARIQVELTAAHVTVLAPFIPPVQVDHRVLEDLQRILQAASTE